MNQIYEAFYARFETTSKNQGSMLMGSDNIIGDDFEVFFKTEEGRFVAWLKNKFGAEIGYFDTDTSRRLQLAQAREQNIRALLSLVAYSEESGPGAYWGEMAVFCFSPLHAEKMNAFIDRVAAKISEGTHPAIDFGSQSIQRIIDDPEWFPNDTVRIPRNEKGMAVLKDHRSVNEKIIEQARAGNKGCYAASIAFIIMLVLLIAYALFSWFA